LPEKKGENMKLGGTEMRRVAILIAVLSVTISANAGVTIGINDVPDPSYDIYLTPSDTAVISLWTDMEIPPQAFYLGIMEGDPGTLDDSQMIPPREPGIPPIPPEIPGWEQIIEIILPDAGPEDPPITGKFVDMIILHCDDLGDVRMALFDGNGELLDGQTVHQIPEPATIVLMGIGVYLLGRKKHNQETER
jgi:hypothetical protein